MINHSDFIPSANTLSLGNILFFKEFDYFIVGKILKKSDDNSEISLDVLASYGFKSSEVTISRKSCDVVAGLVSDHIFKLTPNDLPVGDVILFKEPVFAGSFKNATFVGDRFIVAKITKDSYGADKQQHTFSFEVLASEGAEPLEAGKKTHRKGRKIYSGLIGRSASLVNENREQKLEEKHARGDKARAVRAARKDREARAF